MTTQRLVSLITGVLILAIFLPIGLSLWQAHHRATELFNQEMTRYAERVAARTERVKQQTRSALAEVNRFSGESCSLEHLRQIQKIAYIHQYIQNIFYLEKNADACEFLNNTLSRIVPNSEYTTPAGYKVWLASRHDLQTNDNMLAVSRGKYMAMIDPDSLLDVLPNDAYPIHAALISIQNRQILASNYPLDPTLQKTRLQTYQPELQYNNTVYRQRLLPDIGARLVTWSSMQPLKTNWHRQLMLWLPLGMLLSALAVFLMVRVFRRLRSSHYRLLDAIQSGEITVHYQPVISLETGRLTGAEALARWQQPDGNWLSPELFIALAEQTGMISLLTEHIVRCVFADLGKWLSQHPDMHVAINIAPTDLGSPTLPVLLDQQIARWNLSARQIALEITERDLLSPQTARPLLLAYREKGYSISIDDFGIGYSSLSYLHELEVDTLKIDKTFVQSLDHNLVTGHIIELAKSLNLSMVAEGIETAHQRDWLREHGVQSGQGWLFSKALPKKAFIAWAEQHEAGQ